MWRDLTIVYIELQRWKLTGLYNGPRDARYNLFQNTFKTCKKFVVLQKTKCSFQIQNSNKTTKTKNKNK